MRVAAIGIGSNSLRMLVADLLPGELKRIKRYREGLRVFAALDEKRNISDEMIAMACQSVKAFKEEALAQGASAVHLFATSAVRDAANQTAFCDALQHECGMPLDICSGETEARLSFWGAAGMQKTGLIDIGGGSTEIAVGEGKRIDQAVSLQMGAVRLYRMKPIVTLADAYAVEKIAEEILNAGWQKTEQLQPLEWVGVGGTFTTSAALVQRIPWQDRQQIHGFALTQHLLEEAIRFLAPMPYEERLKLPFLQPQRADIVVHGMAILMACMKRLEIPVLTVSECGNLEGYLKLKYLF